jgi:hypothetical protein
VRVVYAERVLYKELFLQSLEIQQVEVEKGYGLPVICIGRKLKTCKEAIIRWADRMKDMEQGCEISFHALSTAMQLKLAVARPTAAGVRWFARCLSPWRR